MEATWALISSRGLFHAVLYRKSSHLNDQTAEYRQNVTPDIQLLNKFIFLFTNFLEADGGYITCGPSKRGSIKPGYSYQANLSSYSYQMINKWNRSLSDLHGFVKKCNRTCNTCMIPNFEYLLSDQIIQRVLSYGLRGLGSCQFLSFNGLHPFQNWIGGDGWDDSFSGYTGVYAVYHGILGPYYRNSGRK